MLKQKEPKTERSRGLTLSVMAFLAGQPRKKFSGKQIAQAIGKEQNPHDNGINSALQRLCEQGLIKQSICSGCEHTHSKVYQVSPRAVRAGAVTTTKESQ